MRHAQGSYTLNPSWFVRRGFFIYTWPVKKDRKDLHYLITGRIFTNSCIFNTPKDLPVPLD